MTNAQTIGLGGSWEEQRDFEAWADAAFTSADTLDAVTYNPHRRRRVR